MFKIGDIAIALSDRNFLDVSRVKVEEFKVFGLRRAKGEAYKVFGVTNCVGCHAEMICIYNKTLNYKAQMKCMNCDCTSMSSNNIWTMASNFKLKELDPYKELELAVKAEDFERAAVLRDIINANK